MASYNFSLLISAPEVDWETASNAFYEAGCDDALFRASGGAYELEFDRDAASLKEAVLSAIRNVKSANTGARVLRVIPDDLVSANAIAERSGMSRQAVRLWTRGERGEGFPAPVTKVGESLVWSWASVAEWLQGRGKAEGSRVDEAKALIEINGVLERESIPPPGL
jgi:predicted DNA-binding transcriptional regulator AlpA